jgi:hypothetical protein
MVDQKTWEAYINRINNSISVVNTINSSVSVQDCLLNDKGIKIVTPSTCFGKDIKNCKEDEKLYLV